MQIEENFQQGRSTGDYRFRTHRATDFRVGITSRSPSLFRTVRSSQRLARV